MISDEDHFRRVAPRHEKHTDNYPTMIKSAASKNPAALPTIVAAWSAAGPARPPPLANPVGAG